MSATIMQDKQQAIRKWAKAAHNGMRRPTVIDSDIPLAPSRYSIEVKLKDEGLLLFNSVTRSLSRLDKAESARWRSWCEAGTVNANGDPAFVKMLAADGYVVPASFDELDNTRQNYFATRHDPSRMTLTIAPTMACNLACGYCFQGLNKDLGKTDIRLPDAIMGFVKMQAKTIRGLSVTWYGGEPLMAKKDIFALADRMISYCDKSQIEYSSIIVTNGYFLTVEVAEQLWSRRCTSAQVTVDGVEDTHDKMRPLTSGRGSFKTIMDNLTAVLEETPLGISLRVNVGQRNVAECNDLLDDLEKRGFAGRHNFSLYFSPIDAATPESGTAWEEGLARKEYNEAMVALGARAREMRLAPPLEAPKGIMGMCVAAHDNGYVVTHKGDMHKCWETAHDPRKRIGTIFEPEKLDSSLNSHLWKAWSPFDSEVCKSCKILPMCGGFCGHRFLYQGAGNDNALPCPDWKWNTAEYLFARAKAMGVVTDEEWLPQEATVDAMQSGERHSTDSLRAAQTAVLDKVSNARGSTVDADYLLHGDGRFFEELIPPQSS